MSTEEKDVLVLYGEIQAVTLTPYKTHKGVISVPYDNILGT
jgi:hypothetical protein